MCCSCGFCDKDSDICSSFQVDSSYPRPTATWWLGCPDKQQIIQYDKDQALGNADMNMIPPDNSETNNNSDQWLGVNDTGNSNTMQFNVFLGAICLVFVRFL